MSFAPSFLAKLAEDCPLRVLVVDDYPDNAQSMAMLLRFYGHEVVTAESGVAALKLARTQRPDAVLLDVAMPGMNGLEVARGLRKMFPDRPPLLMAITGRGFEENRMACFEAGFDFYLRKPADPNEVARLLEEFAGTSSQCYAGANN